MFQPGIYNYMGDAPGPSNSPLAEHPPLRVRKRVRAEIHLRVPLKAGSDSGFGG